MRQILCAIAAAALLGVPASATPLDDLAAKPAGSCTVQRVPANKDVPAKRLDVTCPDKAAFEAFIKGAPGIKTFSAGKRPEGVVHQVEPS